MIRRLYNLIARILNLIVQGICLIGLPIALPVILVMEACLWGYKPMTISCLRFLGLKPGWWAGVLTPEVVVATGRVTSTLHWLAVPARYAEAMLYSTEYRAVEAERFLTWIEHPILFEAVRRAVAAAQAVHPGCAIFLVSTEDGPHDPDPAVPARVRVVARGAGPLPKPSGRAVALPDRSADRARPPLEG